MKEKLKGLKTAHYLNVLKFMTLADQVVNTHPTMPDPATLYLRAKLITEEYEELMHALGFRTDVEFKRSCNVDPDLVEILDGICDLKVVITGTLIACGITDYTPQELVDRNNLAKFNWAEEELGPFYKAHRGGLQEPKKVGNLTVVKNSLGKVMKPPGHRKVDLESEIKRQSCA